MHSNEIIEAFDQIINDNLMHALSRQHKFIQRSSSKLKGHEFIKVLILPSEGVTEDSLSGLCTRIRNFNPQADISPQALSERLNSKFSTFLVKDVFGRILNFVRRRISNQSPLLLESLGKFNSVKIQDSTVITLHEKVVKFQVKNNRNRRKASEMKIDVIHNLLSNSLVDIQLECGNVPDQFLSERILKYLEPNDLIIRDLGYFSLSVLKMIMLRGAYFISRLLPNVKVYLCKESNDSIDLAAYVKKHLKKAPFMELHVYLGDLKIPVRLILHKAPKEVIKVRYINAKKRSKDTGRIISKGKKFTMDFTCFVTNVPIEMLSTDMVGTIYQLRWEIELIFKRWKSLLKIDIIEGIDSNRIECLIWGRMCMVLLVGLVCHQCNKIGSEMDREISETKIIKYILRESCFCKAIQKDKLIEYLQTMEKDVCRMLCKAKRKRKTMRERVIYNQGYYGAQAFDFQNVA